MALTMAKKIFFFILLSTPVDRFIHSSNYITLSFGLGSLAEIFQIKFIQLSFFFFDYRQGCDMVLHVCYLFVDARDSWLGLKFERFDIFLQ